MKTEKQLQLVTFEQAKRLHKLGFNWAVNEVYGNGGRLYGVEYHFHINVVNMIKAPTVALALKWCRDEKKIDNSVEFCGYNEFGARKWYESVYYKFKEELNAGHRIMVIRNKSYSVAESALLDEILTILEKGN